MRAASIKLEYYEGCHPAGWMLRWVGVGVSALRRVESIRVHLARAGIRSLDVREALTTSLPSCIGALPYPDISSRLPRRSGASLGIMSSRCGRLVSLNPVWTKRSGEAGQDIDLVRGSGSMQGVWGSRESGGEQVNKTRSKW